MRWACEKNSARLTAACVAPQPKAQVACMHLRVLFAPTLACACAAAATTDGAFESGSGSGMSSGSSSGSGSDSGSGSHETTTMETTTIALAPPAPTVSTTATMPDGNLVPHSPRFPLHPAHVRTYTASPYITALPMHLCPECMPPGPEAPFAWAHAWASACACSHAFSDLCPRTHTHAPPWHAISII